MSTTSHSEIVQSESALEHAMRASRRAPLVPDYPNDGRRPYVEFGNSTSDRQMLEYAKSGDGMRLPMLVLHNDAQSEYAYGPARGLPGTKIGTFTEAV